MRQSVGRAESTHDENEALVAIDEIATLIIERTEVIKHWGTRVPYEEVMALISASVAEQVGYEPPPKQPKHRRKIRASLRTAVYERDGYRCVACHAARQLSIDHVTPVHLGGGNLFENLQTLCKPCNSSKGARI